MTQTQPLNSGLTRDARVSGPDNGSAEYAYSTVIPFANYSPWITDAEFQKIYQMVVDFTLVDQYRLYELWQLCEQVCHVEGDVLEVGVWRGGSAVLMAARFLSLKVSLTVYAADTFKGVVKVTQADPSYKGGEHQDTNIAIVQELAYRVNDMPLEILHGIFPEDTATEVENNTFRLVHIDVDIYQSAKDILNWAWPKLNVGGIVVFDDYGFSTCQGITQLVHENKNADDRLIVHNLNGHALFIKLK